MLSSKTKDEAAKQTRNDPLWQQVPTMDTQADGQFYYLFKITDVYWLLSCCARQGNRMMPVSQPL